MIIHQVKMEGVVNPTLIQLLNYHCKKTSMFYYSISGLYVVGISHGSHVLWLHKMSNYKSHFRYITGLNILYPTYLGNILFFNPEI